MGHIDADPFLCAFYKMVIKKASIVSLIYQDSPDGSLYSTCCEFKNNLPTQPSVNYNGANNLLYLYAHERICVR